MWKNTWSAACSRRTLAGWTGTSRHSELCFDVNRLRTYASFVRFSHSVFALPFALTGALLAIKRQPSRASSSSRCAALDHRGNGGRAQRGDGVQPAGRCEIRRAQSADGDARAAARRMSIREANLFVVVSSSCSSSRPGSSGHCASRLSPVALAIVFWYSLAKRVTSYTQLFLGLAMAVAPVGGWLAAGGRGGWEPWLLGLAIGCWVGGFDVLYACQDLDVDRAHGLHSIPVRFGIARSLAISRVMHVMAVAALAALGPVAKLGWFYLAGVAGVAALLVLRTVARVRARPVAGQTRVRSQRLRGHSLSRHNRRGRLCGVSD